uniref:LisH domain-containing protein n=2 Tax=Mesocestoides corti TaxID=53468 RepID=A0A5K3FKM0_MESCO
MASHNEALTAIERFEELMSQWRIERNQAGYVPDETLIKFAELFEEQINAFYRVDPDPLDDRHPLRSESSCELGQLLRLITSHDSFFIRLADYLCASDDPYNSTVKAAARLLCSIQFGVTLSFTVAEADTTISTLYKLALSDAEPTNCYALLLLGSILDNAELLYVTKQRNIELVSVVLGRLATYTAELEREIAENPTSSNDAGFGNRLGSFCLEPITVEMKLRLCMSYLTSLAEYQDMMPYMYDGGVLRYVYQFLAPAYSSRDIRLTFEALRLLANLLCHRCIHLDFVESRGLELLLLVPRPSVAATAVSVVLYYTAYFEDAMERVCTLKPKVLNGLMTYSLWLVECAHPSARCYALYFLSIALCYGATFRIFTEHQGLRYLYNALCVLPIRLTEDEIHVRKDSTSWHVVRASLLTIRRYLDISLLIWMDTLDPSLAGVFDEPPKVVAAAGNRLINYTTEQMNRLLSLVVSRMRPDAVFAPIMELWELGAIPVLYRIIARNAYAHANWPGRNECTRVAVDILNVMSLCSDLADEIVTTDVYSYPGETAFASLSNLFSSHTSEGEEDIAVEDDDDEIRVVIRRAPGAALHPRPSLHRGTAEPAHTRSPEPSTPRAQTARRTANRRSLLPQADIDRLADEPSSEERVNGLLMLFTLTRDDESWDVAVQKAILSFIGTLVYRPIDEREHPDQPVLAISVMPPHALPSSVDSAPPADPVFASPKTSLNRTSLFARGGVGSSRKRKLDDPPGEASPTPCKQVAISMGESCRPIRGAHRSQAPPSLLVRQMRLWAAVRRQHGLMLLIHHLEVTQPISEADSIRTLACRGLVGLARSEEVRSMLAKLPLFTKSQLQLLMKEPILQDRMVEHAEFCRYATLLMRLVLGSLSDGSLTDGDMSLDRVRRAVIVAKTRIQWDQEELLELIWRHLQSRGLHKTASTLQQEARLRLENAVPHQLPLFSNDDDSDLETSATATAVLNHQSTGAATSTTTTTTTSSESTTPSVRVNKIKPVANAALSTPKVYRDRLERTPAAGNLYLKQPQSSAVVPSNGSEPEMSLSKIVESFLLHQHAQCPYPVSVCPRFSLHHPHRCPEPRADTWAGPISDLARLVFARETVIKCHRMRCAPQRFVRRFIHSRFTPAYTVRDLEDDLYTAVSFSKCGDEGAFLGTSSGSVCWVNVEEAGLPVELFRAQTSPISRLEHSRDGRRLLVCADWGEPALIVTRLSPTSDVVNTTSASAPWTTNADDPMFTAEDARYAEFSRTGLQDKIVATYGKVAKVYDLVTGQRIADLFSSVKQSDYIMNKATFSVDDRLVLNDGVVWDTRCSGSVSSPRPVHKIDKFQDLVSGVFHPNGLEVVVGSAVWDMRTWRLLHTVQALDKLEVTFSDNSDVIYAGIFGMDYDDVLDELGQNSRLAMQNMFRTVDAVDYSLIASVDVKHRIEQLALDTSGLHLALVEKLGEKSANEPITQCRIYAIGRKRSDRELENEEQDDEEDDRHHDDEEDEVDLVGSSSSSSSTSTDSDSEGDDDDATDDRSGGSGTDSSWETEEEVEVPASAADDDTEERNDS